MKSKIIDINNNGKVRFSTQGMKIFNGIFWLVANNVDFAFNTGTNFRGSDFGALKWYIGEVYLVICSFFVSKISCVDTEY